MLLQAHYSFFTLTIVSVGCTFIDLHNIECTTSNNETAYCRHIFRCPPLRDLLLGAENEENFLARYKSTCENHNYIVCCPGAIKIGVNIVLTAKEKIPATPIPKPTRSLLKPPFCGKSFTSSSRVANEKNAKLDNIECTTSNNETAYCRHIFRCPPLRDLLHGAENEEEFLAQYKSTCDDYRYIVCCPGARKFESDIIQEEIPVTPKPKPTHTLLKPPFCGTSFLSSSRIVNGKDAKLDEFPWMAALGYKDSQDSEEIKWMCGGSLITEKHVLTAAHCIIRTLFIVRLGDLNLYNDEDGAHTVDARIERINVHENNSRNEKDVAIISLKATVAGRHIRPICLPIGETRSFENFYPWVAGWGRLSRKGPLGTTLQVAMVPVIPNSQCKIALEKVRPFEIVDETVLCAGSSHGGTDSCEGDSGGPMMWVKVEGEDILFYQIGIVSWGYKCAEAGFPGVYTRITYFIDWIEQNLN